MKKHHAGYEKLQSVYLIQYCTRYIQSVTSFDPKLKAEEAYFCVTAALQIVTKWIFFFHLKLFSIFWRSYFVSIGSAVLYTVAAEKVSPGARGDMEGLNIFKLEAM